MIRDVHFLIRLSFVLLKKLIFATCKHAKQIKLQRDTQAFQYSLSCFDTISPLFGSAILNFSITTCNTTCCSY